MQCAFCSVYNERGLFNGALLVTLALDAFVLYVHVWKDTVYRKDSEYGYSMRKHHSIAYIYMSQSIYTAYTYEVCFVFPVCVTGKLQQIRRPKSLPRKPAGRCLCDALLHGQL